MVISQRHKYIYVELQLTGSCAISEELCENYSGERILSKHSRFHEFSRICKDAHAKYFVFSGIRNPLDITVSQYFKAVSNHNRNFTNPKKWKKYGGTLPEKALKRYIYIKNNNADFSDYFKKFYAIPYDDWSRIYHKKMDFIIRFERIEEDFSEVLKLIGLKQIRSLPVVNKTAIRGTNFLEYYNNDELKKKAIRIFGPFLKKWNYDLPDSWGNIHVPLWSRIEFELLGTRRYMKWRYWK